MIVVKTQGKMGKGVLVTEFVDEALQFITTLMTTATDIVVEIRPGDMGRLSDARMEDRVPGEALDGQPGSSDALPNRGTLSSGMADGFQDADEGSEGTEAQ